MIFQCINNRQGPREVLKTAASGLGFQHLHRDLANVNAWKTMFDPYSESCLPLWTAWWGRLLCLSLVLWLEAFVPSVLFVLPLGVISMLQLTLVISKFKGFSEILRDIRTSAYESCRTEDKINLTTTIHKNEYAVWLLKLKIYWKYCGKGEIEQFLLFSTIFCYLLLDFHVKTETNFSLRDKRLFEISEVEITRVDCMFCLYGYSGTSSILFYFIIYEFITCSLNHSFYSVS